MEYRKLGRTGERISVISLGTAPLGGLFGKIDPQDGIHTVHRAIDQGINFIDTSPYYGNAETVLGEALTGRRDEVLVGTKVGRFGVNDFDFSKRRMMASVERSLRLLNTDYVDFLQAHDIEFVDLEPMFAESYEALITLRQQGKCRFIGMTGFPLKTLRRAMESCELDVVLSYGHYTLYDTTLDDQLMEFAADKGVGIINAAAVAMGLLTPQGPRAQHPAPDSLKAVCRRAHKFCESRGADISILALQFCLAHPQLATTVIGTSKTEKLKRNLSALTDPLDEELLKGVQEIQEGKKDGKSCLGFFWSTLYD